MYDIIFTNQAKKDIAALRQSDPAACSSSSLPLTHIGRDFCLFQR